jgi:hypothetical protein
MSISTLRRKIKANSIDHKMEEGRYLIRLDEDEPEDAAPPVGFQSNDGTRPTTAVPPPLPKVEAPPSGLDSLQKEIDSVRTEMGRGQEANSLRWRALEARVAGLAKKLDSFTEQMAELKMLVKIFEERLDGRL